MNRRNKILITIAAALLAIVIALGAWLYSVYNTVFKTPAGMQEQPVSIYLPTGAGYQQLKDSLLAHQLVKDTALFRKLAEYKELKSRVYAGHYRIQPDISLNTLVNKFRGGLQDPVNVTFNNIRDVEKLAGIIGRQLALDSAELSQLMKDRQLLDSLGTGRLQLLGFFIPNTYEFYWNTGARDFLFRMKKEREKFWSKSRRQKAEAMGLSPEQVATLASIVQEETNKVEEMDKIAGVYINRLETGMPLQADPTLKFALDDWSIRRVLNRDKEIKSPYNTYMFKGLPPGPISMPSPQAIDQVLNYQDHNYLYFVASAERPGFHEFSKTLRQHNIKANKYRRHLSERKIYR